MRHGQPSVAFDRGAEHVRALIEANDTTAIAAAELARDHPRAGRDVEHDVGGCRGDRGDERVAPARILAEREDRSDAVVGVVDRKRPKLLRRGIWRHGQPVCLAAVKPAVALVLVGSEIGLPDTGRLGHHAGRCPDRFPGICGALIQLDVAVYILRR